MRQAASQSGQDRSTQGRLKAYEGQAECNNEICSDRYLFTPRASQAHLIGESVRGSRSKGPDWSMFALGCRQELTRPHSSLYAHCYDQLVAGQPGFCGFAIDPASMQPIKRARI
jgi:hypothetical protein